MAETMTMHGVKNPDGTIFPYISEATAMDATREMEEFTQLTWDELLALGYLCVPVEARELKEDKFEVYDEIRLERMRQDEKWGGPDHDDEHLVHNWSYSINQHANAAYFAPSSEESRRELVQVAALAVAAIESLDRKGGGA